MIVLCTESHSVAEIQICLILKQMVYPWFSFVCVVVISKSVMYDGDYD
jgi:hypothetical protein